METELTLKTIAHIHTDFPTKFGIPRQSGIVDALKATIVFTPAYRNVDALRGMEDFSHLWLIWEFSESVRKTWSPTVRPPRLGGNTRMGVFATRSPFRPNALGLSCVKLNGIDYRAYLRMLTNHHTMPVVISEFGVSTGRGMAQYDANTGRNQGHMSEKDQGDAIVQCYEDIRSVGCAGCCVFTWQDEWFKRTWNTMYAVDLKRNPYWSDYQTNEQYFGFLSFDPGNEKSVCYVDGDLSEWTKDNVVIENRDMALSMKYDEKFIYFLIEKNGLDFDTDTLFVPIDTTPKSGSTYCENNGLLFERPADFLIVIDGKENSRVLVQERYESLRSTYAHDVYGYDTYLEGNIPAVDSPVFVNINLVLQTQMAQFIQYLKEEDYRAQTFETGALRYGNANPDSPDFDSLADFICTGDFIELKLPWQLLNFADPSRMEIHDDYYDGNYGVEYIDIDEMYVGIAGAAGPEGTSSLAAERILMNSFSLKGWGNKVTSHERLKSSYYILQGVWANK